MKIIERSGELYARHWFKWYWLNLNILRPITKVKKEEEE